MSPNSASTRPTPVSRGLQKRLNSTREEQQMLACGGVQNCAVLQE